MTQLDKYRAQIAEKVRALRKARLWTQSELAQKLGISQSRLSEIERGDGSFTAEQLLLILQLFNVAASHFSPTKRSTESDLQNALARLGATHLREVEDVVPSERFNEVSNVVREVLELGTPRFLTALAPVLVCNLDRPGLLRLHSKLRDPFLQRRLAWLAENLFVVVGEERKNRLSTRWRRLYQQAWDAFRVYLASVAKDERLGELPTDTLDASIRSEATVARLLGSSSDISRRWNIVSSLQPGDFLQALRGARTGD